MAGKEDGLVAKYDVKRLIPSSTGKTHEDCRYFVLDIDHDPLALDALHAYAIQAEQAGYQKLSDDLYDLLNEKGYDG